MRLVGNIIWLIFGGLISAIAYFVAGVVLCLTLIGIPFGLQMFKFARLTFSPFGKRVNTDIDRHMILNVIWLVLGGAFSSIGFAIAGTVFCITLIFIPFGLQFFKLMRLSLAPFGARVYN